MFKKIAKLGLLPLVLMAIGLGIGAGFVFPDWLTAKVQLFSQITKFFIHMQIFLYFYDIHLQYLFITNSL